MQIIQYYGIIVNIPHPLLFANEKFVEMLTIPRIGVIIALMRAA